MTFLKNSVTYNFKNNSVLETRNGKSVYIGSETISFLGPQIWELLPSNIKDSENLNIFKPNIRSWKPKITSKKKIILVYKFCFTCSRSLSAYVYLGMFLFAHVRVCMRACAYMRMCCVCVCMWICVRRYACVYLYICMHAFFFHLVYMKLKILLKSYF